MVFMYIIGDRDHRPLASLSLQPAGLGIIAVGGGGGGVVVSTIVGQVSTRLVSIGASVVQCVHAGIGQMPMSQCGLGYVSDQIHC